MSSTISIHNVQVKYTRFWSRRASMFDFFRISPLWNTFRHETSKTFRAITCQTNGKIDYFYRFVHISTDTKQNKTISIHSPFHPWQYWIPFDAQQMNKQLLKLQFSNAFCRVRIFVVFFFCNCMLCLEFLLYRPAVHFLYRSFPFPLLILYFFVILVCFKHTFHHHCHCPF